MTIPFRPDPPRKPSRLQQALEQILMAQSDATRVRSAVPQHLTRPRGVMRETPAGPSALPLPNAPPASQERGVDAGSRAIMGLVDASDAVLEGGQAVRAAREGRFRNAIGHALLAAAPVASSTSVRAVGGAIGDAFRGLREGPLAGTRVVDESGMPKRVYHGTPAVFDEFDMNRVDPNGLYGPGLYWTEDPHIAGGVISAEGRVDLDGYATKPIVSDRSKLTPLMKQIGALRAERARAGASDPARAQQIDSEIRRLSAEANALVSPEMAPNVRPARLAITNPFDADKRYTADEAVALVEKIGAPNAATVAKLIRSTFPNGISGGDLYEKALQAWTFAGDLAKTNAGLRSAGFDGITHIGGRNTGRDPHKVWIAFDRSQVRSAFDPPETARQVGAALLTTGAGAAALSRPREKKDK